jgi:hypothetical protein
VQDLLDLAGGRAAVDLLDDAGITAVLRAATRIALWRCFSALVTMQAFASGRELY